MLSNDGSFDNLTPRQLDNSGEQQRMLILGFHTKKSKLLDAYMDPSDGYVAPPMKGPNPFAKVDENVINSECRNAGFKRQSFHFTI